MCCSFIESEYAQKLVEKLRKMIDANIPIVYIDSCDYARTDAIILDARIDKTKSGTNVLTWDPTANMTTDGGKEKDENTRLVFFLRDIYENHKNNPDGIQTFIVLKGIHDFIEDPTIKMLLINLAQLHIYGNGKDRHKTPVRDNTTIFIVSSVVTVPKELEMYVSYLDIPYPDKKEIDRIIEEHRETNDAPEIDVNTKAKLIEYLLGSTEYEIDSILDMALSVNGELNAEDNNLIKEQKRERVRRSKLLDYINLDNVSEYDVGGLVSLQKYIATEGCIIKNLEKAKDFGVPSPKGIFLWGEPGCGKSLSAKVIAKRMNVPLLKLDMGRMLGSLQGQAEARMREALRIADATAPCILWVDEIEKGFSGVNGVGGSSDSTTHMFGYFLTWLQERESAVYVIATANHPEYLPKELMRKGRFDRLFYLGLPLEKDRKQIFGLNLYKFFKQNKYYIDKIDQRNDIGESVRIQFDDDKQNPCNLEYYKEKCNNEDTKKLFDSIIANSENWSGAEIESATFSAIKECFINDKEEFDKDNKDTIQEGLNWFIPRLEEIVRKEKIEQNNKEQIEQKKKEQEDIIWLREHSIDSSTGEHLKLD